MTLKKYKRQIDPGKVNGIKDLIDEKFSSPEPDPIVYTAVCHKLLYDKVDYHHSGDRVHSPDTMLDRLSGDCQDHTTLLASLYKACDLAVTLVTVPGHIFLEVQNPLIEVGEACDSLRRFYYNQFDIYPEEIGYEEYKGIEWFIVDTAGGINGGWTNYVGDISSHSGEYLDKNRSCWEWTDLEKKAEV